MAPKKIKLAVPGYRRAPPTIYQRIERATEPLETLGLYEGATTSDVKSAYRALALLLHPDKLPEESLHDRHLQCFLNVHAAYETLLESGGASASSDERGAPPPQQQQKEPVGYLDDDLHARNVDFKEALKAARADAVEKKKQEDAKLEKLKEYLGPKAEKAATLAAWEKRKDVRKLRQSVEDEKRKFRTRVRRGEVDGKNIRALGRAARQFGHLTPEEWKAKEEREAASAAEKAHKKTIDKRPMWRPGKIVKKDGRQEPQASKKDAVHWQTKALLSGGSKTASVSFAEKARKEAFREKVMLMEEEWWQTCIEEAAAEGWMLA